MRTAKYHVALLFAALLANGPELPTAGAAGPETQAISGAVSGNVQKVGFRPMILKQAIEYNLAGSVQNTTEGTVQSGCKGHSQWNQEILRCECQHIPGQGRSKSRQVHGRRLDVRQPKNHSPL
jgi:acylphosphatase